MHQFVEFIQSLATSMGAPGLAVIAFLDSSFLTLPEACDILIVVFVVQHPAWWLVYASLATAGSVAGNFVLFWLAHRGGKEFLERRMKKRKADRYLAMYRRHGLLAVIVPAMLPPPVPLKVFVLLAGAAGVRRRTFLWAISLGRGARYFAIAIMAFFFGAGVKTFLQQHTVAASLSLAGAAGAAVVIVMLWRRRRAS